MKLLQGDRLVNPVDAAPAAQTGRRVLGVLALVVAWLVLSGCWGGERHVSLDGQPNFRDLGGYRTADGRTVRWGQVYRSGELSRLSDADESRLEALGIQSVVNFLTPEEIASRGPNRLPEGVREISLPIAGGGDDLALLALEARSTGDFSKLPPELNVEIHRILVREAGRQYAALIRSLLDSANRPVVFHCSHGVHRTGTGAAVLLSALGVPWETIRRDYLLSNTYRADEVERRLIELRKLAAKNQGIEPESVDTTSMEAFYRLQGAYIDGSFEAIVEDYGGIDAYLEKGLGITQKELLELRAELLE